MRFFVSDAHLSAVRPERARAFFSFLGGAARRAREVYLLGDIFDLWAGDDENGELAAAARGAISELAGGGAAVYLQRGNRDFLLGRRFCRDCGCVLLPDLHILECGGRRFLLAHGDLFCEDAAYLRYRAVVRSAAFAAAARALPLSRRRKIAAQMGGASRGRRRKTELSLPKIAAALRRGDCQTLIHGHTHVAEAEEWTDGGECFYRRALPDWETNGGGWMEMDESGKLELKFV
ncbi:MAG: UDP-2,3-diacylglucosamine diphosphatase [Gammaproteobacteria bacterium]